MKSHGCSKCRTRENGGVKSNSTYGPFSPDAHGPAGWTRSSFSGLRSRGAAAASPSDHHTPSHPSSPPRPYHIRALKNTLLDTHEPPTSFSGPTETRTFVRKPWFFSPLLLLLATVNSAERIAAASARFLISQS